MAFIERIELMLIIGRKLVLSFEGLSFELLATQNSKLKTQNCNSKLLYENS
jgi:hypothetical protein